MSMKEIMASISKGVVKNSTTILTGFAVAGVFGTAATATKDTKTALQLIELEKERTNREFLSKKEIIKVAWKCYIPTIAMGTATTICIVGSNKIALKRNAILASAYTLTETALKEYQKEVAEEIGEKKEAKIRDNIARNQITENPVSTNEVYMTGKGEHLCYESLSGRYFQSDIEDVKQAVNSLNAILNQGDIVSLSDFFEEIGLESTILGDELGWSGMDGSMIDIHYSSHLSPNGTPCLHLGYRVRPTMDYMD